MQIQADNYVEFRSGGKSRIWVAWLLAFVVHSIILIMPVSDRPVVDSDEYRRIEVQLTKSIPPPVTLPEPAAEPIPLPEPEPEPLKTEPEPLKEPEPLVNVADIKPEPVPIADKKVMPERATVPYESHSSAEKSHLTHTILSAQFITEESAADQLFGKQFDLEISDPQPGFHYPVRQSMISMLDQPMPDLPFAYTPGLVHFAYDPGVKGDLQRFWDVITPEFGWCTKNGTEFKCVGVLIVAGCGWK